MMILCYLVTLCCLAKSIIRLFEFFNHFSPYIHKQKNLCNLKINFLTLSLLHQHNASLESLGLTAQVTCSDSATTRAAQLPSA